MEARAIARYMHVSPQKARLVADMVRGQEVEAALAILDFTPKKSAALIAKILRSAIANAEDQQNVDVDDLYVKTIFVDGGPVSGRFRPRAQGRATPIRKRTSHITIVVDSKGGTTASAED
jgi:large subunit ribosomal protein L22